MHNPTMNLYRRFLVCLPLFCCFGLFGAAGPAGQAASTNQAQVATLRAEMEDAITKAKAIINQPVKRYARTRGMRVSTFEQGWFHEGAFKPDFKAADVRVTRETPYDKYPYVTSDLNPGVAFRGSDLEFNSMTKYFYTDRTLPKKKLTEEEMLEINRLYQIIGRCEQQIAELEGPPDGATESKKEAPPSALVSTLADIPRSTYLIAIGALVLFLIVYSIFRKRAS